MGNLEGEAQKNGKIGYDQAASIQNWKGGIEVPSETFVVGLNGREIVNDVLDQVEKALLRDCNLRESDSYGQGYEGTIEITLKCRSLDVTEVHVTAEVQTSPELQKQADENAAKAAKAAENAGTPAPEVNEKEFTITDKVEVELEPDLNAVRERSNQGVPMQSVGENGESTIRRRTYRNVEGGALESPDTL